MKTHSTLFIAVVLLAATQGIFARDLLGAGSGCGRCPYGHVCQQKYVKVCPPKVCKTQYLCVPDPNPPKLICPVKEVCQQVPEKVCKKIPVVTCPDVKVLKCVDEPKQDCRVVKQKVNCRTVHKKVCDQVVEDVCRQVPYQDCKQVPVQKCDLQDSCRKVPSKVCKKVPSPCGVGYGHHKPCKDGFLTKCRTVYKQVCDKKKVCKEVLVKKCVTKQKKQCTPVKRLKCKHVPQKVCDDKDVKICKTVSHKVCKYVIQKGPCTTTYKDDCKQIFKKVCKKVKGKCIIPPPQRCGHLSCPYGKKCGHKQNCLKFECKDKPVFKCAKKY